MLNKKIFLLLILSIVASLIGCQKDSESNELTQKTDMPPENEESLIQAYGIVELPNRQNIIIDFPVLVKEIHVKNGEKVGQAAPCSL